MAALFQRRINAGTDTFLASARPVGAGETATKGRPLAVFSEAHQRRYRYIYCGIPTGGCRQNRNERAANGRPFFDNVAVSTADLITPHPSPKVTPSPQAPQGEDNGVQTKFCTDIAQSSGTRNAMVYSNVPNRATGKFSAALALREATTVSSATSTPGYRNMRIRSSLNSPLKLLCSGGRVRFRGLRPWSASSSAGTSCLRPP